ncbi:MAG: nitroreductase family protein [Chloroflexota bacterium]|jgi:nitroreductase
MDVIEAILTRHSIRQYKSRPVSEVLLVDIIKAAMAAPSAGNQQPWHFVIIDDRKILETITKYHPHAQMLLQAPAAIAVCGDLRLEKHHGYWVQDCSAAAQNLMLAAHAKGLGSVWIGIYPQEERVGRTRDLLRLPKEVIPLAIISLGYPNEVKSEEDRFDQERIHRNRW